MNKIKELYSSPTTKILVVRFEGMLCQSQYGTAGSAGGIMTVNNLGEGDDDLY